LAYSVLLFFWPKKENPFTAGLYFGDAEIARTDIAGTPKLWGLTSRDWTTRDQVAWLDIARPDNAAPIKQKHTIFILHGILYELHLSVCNSLLHLCILLYTALVFMMFFDEAK